MNALQFPVALTMVRALSGLPGYPRLPEGEAWTADRLCEFVVSVDHARAVLAAIEEHFPTIKELRDTADSLRGRFEAPPPSEKDQWLAEGAVFDPEWSEKLLGTLTAGTPQQFAEIRRRSMRDALWYTIHPEGQREWRAHLAEIRNPADRQREKSFWDLAKQRHEREHAEEFAQVRAEMQEPGAWDEYLEAA